MNAADLPPLREVIAAHGLAARKKLGQHFLLDLNITRKIAAAAGPLEKTPALEIGPGPGGLTRALLEAGAHVLAIERDGRCVEALAALAQAYPGRLAVIEADALETDEAALITERFGENAIGAVRIISNLPYNISTPLLVKWLTARPRVWSEMILMFQREVADRILAGKGGKIYGRLSVIAQAAAAPSRLFDLPARAFTPPPSVDSSVLRFAPRDIAPNLLDALQRLTAAAFGQRRKMLRASLKPLFAAGGEMETALAAAGVAPTARAEELSVDDFLRLAMQIQC